ncbi:MAG: alpha/beta hydrolase [Propionibacteriales bacterium]|nr:alpha/beta hydrolase [Propionibacteriales bacterium]
MSSAVRSPLLALGLAVAALGAALVARPFASTDTLAVLVVAALAGMTVSQLLGAPRPWTWSVRISAVAWLTAAIVIGTGSGSDSGTMALVTGAALATDGVARAVSALTAGAARPFVNVVLGLGGAVLGVMALAWPDPDVGVVAALFGTRALWFGATVFWSGVRGTLDEAEPFEPGSVRRITTTTASAVALVLAATAGAASYRAHDERPAPLDALAIPTDVPSEPGRLISAEEFDTAVPSGARAWRILYTTTRSDGVPALSSGLIVAGSDAPKGPRPVIAWAHGTTGIDTSCAPSADPTPFTFATIPALGQALDAGWVVVATDYIGLGTPGPHPYLIGQGEGRSVLDSVRAAHEFTELDLADKTVAWGHSQGGGAALWAGILAPTYAPDVDLVGVAGIAPATDLVGLVDTVAATTFGPVFAAYVLQAYAAAYPDVDPDPYLQPAARTPMRQLADFCLSDQRGLLAFAQANAAVFSAPLYTGSARSGPLGKRLRQNTPDGPIAAPTLIVQGDADALVLPGLQAKFIAGRCTSSRSGPLTYRTYPGREHGNIISPGSPMLADLLTWTTDRFAGRPAPTTC